MNGYLEDLDETGNSLMIYKDGRLIYQSKSKGIRPHLEAIEVHGEALSGTVMVDKIVGRAAALLILYSGAAETYAQVLSRPGKQESARAIITRCCIPPDNSWGYLENR